MQAFPLRTELVDGSEVVTEDVGRDVYRTAHVRNGVELRIELWASEAKARAGHSELVRTITALLYT